MSGNQETPGTIRADPTVSKIALGNAIDLAAHLSQQGNWLISLNQIIEDCGTLKEGWDGDHAEIPGWLAVKHAKEIVCRCWTISFKPTKILPSVEGGIAISFESTGKYADMECFNTGDILAVVSDRKNEPDVWKLDINSIENTLERIRGFLSK
jgi:hypothetical protein